MIDADTSPRRSRLALLLVLLSGCALILPRLGSQSLWVDEAFTILPVLESGDIVQMLDRVRATDSQPPASHLVLWVLRDVVPRTEFGWRLPSFLFCESAVVLLYAAAARLWGRRAGLLSAVAAQVSPFLVFYAMEARGYALWSFSICASLYAMIRWARALGLDVRGAPAAVIGAAGRSGIWLAWAVPWGVANAVGLWTHPFHIFAMVMQVVLVVALAVRAPDVPHAARRILVSGLVAQALAILLFLPCLAAIIQREPIAHGVGWTRTPTVASLLYYPFALVFGFSLGPDLHELHSDTIRSLLAGHLPALAAAGLALLALGLAALRVARGAWREPRGRGTVVVVIVATAAGLAGPALYTVARSFPLLPRHLMFVWPLIPVLQGLAFVRLPRLRPALLAVLALQGLALGNLLWNPAYAKDDERAAVRYAERVSGPAPVVLGDVAPVYAAPGRGRLRNLTDPGDAAVYADATDVWLVDSRAWEDPEGRYHARLQRTMDRLGFRYAGEEGTFRGLVLRHWRRVVSS